jgi:exosortase
MAETWYAEPEYSHGWLVPLFALALLWFRRDQADDLEFRFNWWGIPLLAVGLAVWIVASVPRLEWLPGVSLLLCLAGVSVLFGDWRSLRWTGPAIAFLIFMVPLPWSVKVALAHPLQRIGTVATTYVMQTVGFKAVASGNIIDIVKNDTEVMRIGVEEACSGLSMLMVFFALSSAVALLAQRPLLDRIVVFLSAVPIAIVSNIIRIVVTALLYLYAGKELGDKFFHDWAGYAMMVWALGLLWLEMKLLSLLLVEEEPDRPGLMVRPGAGPRPQGGPASA